MVQSLAQDQDATIYIVPKHYGREGAFQYSNKIKTNIELLSGIYPIALT